MPYEGLPEHLCSAPTSRFDDYDEHEALAAAADPDADAASIESTAAGTWERWRMWRALPSTGRTD